MDWISVKDRLPEDAQYVIAFNGRTMMSVFYFDIGAWKTCDNWCLACVTHWLPLPEPPKME